MHIDLITVERHRVFHFFRGANCRHAHHQGLRISPAATGGNPRTAWIHVEPAEPIHPVFVTVLKARIPGPEVLAAEMQGIAAAVASNLDRPPEKVHVVYEPDTLGRIGFGGVLVDG